jgi:hypothetical protein
MIGNEKIHGPRDIQEKISPRGGNCVLCIYCPKILAVMYKIKYIQVFEAVSVLKGWNHIRKRQYPIS